MEPCLPVEYVHFDETVEITGDLSKMSAEQYLSWVRSQSSRLPSVFRATNVIASLSPQTASMPTANPVSLCPVQYLPSRSWERETLHQFSQLRLALYNKSLVEASKERRVVVPQLKDRNAWLVFCLGDEAQIAFEAASVIDSTLTNEKLVNKRKRELAVGLGIEMVELEEGEEEEEDRVVATDDMNVADQGDDNDDYDMEIDVDDPNLVLYYTSWTGLRGVEPSTALILQFDQVLAQRLFTFLVQYFSKKPFSSKCSEWIYALLARVEKPLHRDVVATIRQLFCRCCELRNQLTTDNESFDNYLASLNLLIAITGYYFGQGENFDSTGLLPDEKQSVKGEEGKEVFGFEDFVQEDDGGLEDDIDDIGDEDDAEHVVKYLKEG